jgi:hypothetical protein
LKAPSSVIRTLHQILLNQEGEMEVARIGDMRNSYTCIQNFRQET